MNGHNAMMQMGLALANGEYTITPPDIGAVSIPTRWFTRIDLKASAPLRYVIDSPTCRGNFLFLYATEDDVEVDFLHEINTSGDSDREFDAGGFALLVSGSDALNNIAWRLIATNGVAVT